MQAHRIKFLLVTVLLLSFHWAEADSSIRKIWRNNRAAGMLGQDKREQAFDEFTQLLAEEPFNPVFQYNVGTAFLGIEEAKKAAKIFKDLAHNKNLSEVIQFAARYNLGVIHQALNEREQALKAYQSALELQPDSKEIKINIELMMSSNPQSGGGGEGNQDQKDKQQGDKDQQNEPQKFENPPQKGQPKPKQMSPQDVKNILEELKKQEQRIRAKHDRKGTKEKDREKNW